MEVKKFKSILTEYSPEHFLGEFVAIDLKFRVLLDSTEILCEVWSDEHELLRIRQIKRSKGYKIESVEALLFHEKFKPFVEQQLELLMEVLQQDEHTQKYYKRMFHLTHTEFEEYIVDRFGVLKEKIKQRLEELEKMNQHVENTKTSEKEGGILMCENLMKEKVGNDAGVSKMELKFLEFDLQDSINGELTLWLDFEVNDWIVPLVIVVKRPEEKVRVEIHGHGGPLRNKEWSFPGITDIVKSSLTQLTTMIELAFNEAPAYVESEEMEEILEIINAHSDEKFTTASTLERLKNLHTAFLNPSIENVWSFPQY